MELVASLLRIERFTETSDIAPRWNVAPTQRVLIARLDEQGSRALFGVRWGLIPGWAKDAKIGARMINARSETASEKPSFRNAWRRRRCIVPADGFYEWMRRGDAKRPFCFRRADGNLMGMAGIWEAWQGPEGDAVECCAILTTAANGLVAAIHDRMPVILDPADFGAWLDVDGTSAAEVSAMARPCSDDILTSYEVSRLVNNARNDQPACCEPISGGRC